MWPIYMWLDVRDAFCCRFSVFRDFSKRVKNLFNFRAFSKCVLRPYV